MKPVAGVALKQSRSSTCLSVPISVYNIFLSDMGTQNNVGVTILSNRLLLTINVPVHVSEIIFTHNKEDRIDDSITYC